MNGTAATPGERYRDGIAGHRWESDPAQLPVITEFDRLHAGLCAPVAAPAGGLFGRLRNMLGSEPRQAVPGLYLWGSVGRGKTFLMDLFVSSLAPGLALRRHFHRFMLEVHGMLRELGERQNPLDEVAGQLAAKCRVLCLDEFLVSDIGDAMILAGLLDGLFARGVTLVTTSNTPPSGLYKDGLQRARFLPAIAAIEKHCVVHEMVSPRDWRLRALSQASVYLVPPGLEAEHSLTRIFSGQAQGDTIDGGELAINGREVPVRKRAGNIVWFDFAALCEGPRAVADYIELARAYPAVIVSNVPQFTVFTENEAKRFVLLVDEFYDRHVKLVISAAAPITELYDGTKLRAEFGRTESRLIEMQSEDYLGRDHKP
ncbi:MULTISPECIES: cell division protein ZapE [Rhodanobacteraceae]|uniref:cell division protein ZapE n=1 Tax=Rhodanobacteraceae TaxID=1775411 RepID=UPI0008870925|nr:MULTISPECIES: cell division protein ZapE [Rhodanobacteraceae]SDG67991.1 cell division protein ZapE [Dyella sp. 333MFSha]SKB39154.1 cell division protein ZapE [Luteibacter sp. 22Crub2.1]